MITEITDKRELTIKLVCIIIIIILGISIYLNGRSLNCDKCQINFYSESMASGKLKLNVSIIELYNNFMQNRCLIKFDRNIGYQYVINISD